MFTYFSNYKRWAINHDHDHCRTILRFDNWANLSTTFSMSILEVLSLLIDNVPKFPNLLSSITLFKYVFTRFRQEKYRSFSAVVIGMVKRSGMPCKAECSNVYRSLRMLEFIVSSCNLCQLSQIELQRPHIRS